MSANRAVPAWPGKSAAEPREAAAAPRVEAERPQTAAVKLRFVTAVQPATTVQPAVTEFTRTPALRVVPLLRCSLPRQFVRVPTHAVGVHPEQRQYPRAKLKLPLRLRAVGGVREQYPITLVMRDISSTGIYFLGPKHVEAGTSIELEVVLVSKPMGCGSVLMTTMAHVCRVEPAAMPGWYGLAASFDDVQFDHDDVVPSRFLKP
jgi:hypothetical protein